VFLFLIGELAVCAVVAVLLGMVILTFCGIGYLVKTFMVLTHALLQQSLPRLQAAPGLRENGTVFVPARAAYIEVAA